ncbi:MAG: hypothetical protein ACM3X4_06275 [Ignavibacteriales bacterium]
MSIEVLNRIRDAEKAAEMVIEASRARAAEMLSSAEVEAEKTVERARDAAEAEAKRVTESILAAARQEAEKIRKDAEAGAREYAARASGRMSRAVDLIVERVVKADGRS